MGYNSPRLPPITLLMVIIEFLVIIGFSIAVTSQFLEDDPHFNLPGYEGEYLTSSATFAAASLQKYGYLPLWQPYLARGEPLLDSPFSFVLNPISSVPSLLYGSRAGIRYSVVLTTILAGLGGWALARMLGLGSLSRVLLGLLLVGKGNMVAMIGNGFFQLGGSQAYIAWIVAGTIGVLRLKHQRSSVVLTALMFALMFWAGNIYFLLPTLMSVIGLGVTHVLGGAPKNEVFRFAVDKAALARLIAAGLLTLGLSAVTFLPIFLHQENIGNHPPELDGGARTDIITVATMFFSDSTLPYELGAVPVGPPDYQSYVLPFWFGLLAFIAFPLVALRLVRPAKSERWKVAGVGVFMIVFCLLWATGQNPVMLWLYANVPFFAQWRFIGRILSIVSFWLAVLAAMQVDTLWQALRTSQVWERIVGFRYAQIVPRALMTLMVVTSLVAATQVIGQWKYLAGPSVNGVSLEDKCIEWLRREYPDQELSVWTLGYSTITSYLLNDVRHTGIAAAYLATGNPPTIFNRSLTDVFPEFGIGWDDRERGTLRENGYIALTDSPLIDPGIHCLWRKPDALPYAFTTPYSALETLTDTLPYDAVTPVSVPLHYPDHLAMVVEADPDSALVLTVQEVSYPGWMVEIDHQPAKLESVGGLLGVVLPPGDRAHVVSFAYRPPLLYLGGVITLVTAAVCIVYLLRLDRFIPQQWIVRFRAATHRAGQSAQRILLSPEIFEPRNLPPEVPLLAAPIPSAERDEAAPVDGEVVEESETP